MAWASTLATSLRGRDVSGFGLRVTGGLAWLAAGVNFGGSWLLLRAASLPQRLPSGSLLCFFRRLRGQQLCFQAHHPAPRPINGLVPAWLVFFFVLRGRGGSHNLDPLNLSKGPLCKPRFGGRETDTSSCLAFAPQTRRSRRTKKKTDWQARPLRLVNPVF